MSAETVPLGFDSGVRYLQGVGSVRAALLERLGISTVGDLLYYFPRRYEDRREISSLDSLVPGNTYASVVKVVSVERRVTSVKRMSIIRAAISDGKSLSYAVWFNRKGLDKILKPGLTIAVYGKVEYSNRHVQFSNPEFEIVWGDEAHDVGRIIPVYPLTNGVNERWLRRLVESALEAHLDKVEEVLPQDLLDRLGLMSVRDSVREMHFPTSSDNWKRARRRLAFEEFFLLQVGLAVRRRSSSFAGRSRALGGDGNFKGRFLQALPFELTRDQRKTVDEIVSDMSKEVPMNRLLQGDVGSGKTVVAVLAMLQALDNGSQAVLMAPTSVLAQQHWVTLDRWLSPLGIDVGLLVGSTSASDKQKLCQQLASGEVKVVVGTHALLEDDVEFADLGLIVIDEQHRFGVLQRKALMAKSGEYSPHVLVMTATPIPRTLALSIYGDLSISTIREIPGGRMPVKTYWIKEDRVSDMLGFLDGQIAEGRQVYWVCPLIEESENLNATPLESRFESLKGLRPEFRIEMLHGRMSQADKVEVMRRFSQGNVDLLVSTTVIEVGVDVPNASIMVIEGAERFGLSQLHQLRGRVGRGSFQSWAILIAAPGTPEAVKRMEAICASSDGFRISEFDMKLRGPGEFCGIRQHGLTDFRVADITRDGDLMEMAKDEAQALVGSSDVYARNSNLMRAVLGKYGELLEIAGVS